ncbi:MAG: S49 family peptidase [Planctomycetota bacterium]
MDFEQNNSFSQPPEPRPQPQPQPPVSGFGAAARAAPPPPPPRRKSGWRIFWRIVLSLSILTNIVLFLFLVGFATLIVSGQGGILAEETVRKGPAKNKIVVVSVQGIIHGEAAGDLYRQLEQAKLDPRVKGLIVRVNSPGGTISASDRIYKEIRKFRDKENKPPTTITGSIGVISSYFVVQGLLEEKLGVLPVTIKSGKKKDWPSSFKPPTEEQIQYMQEKLIAPALARFVEVVEEGRAGSLTSEQVKSIATEAEIYGAQEALDEKLIDQIGYLDEAIALIKSMAQIDDAQVVQYRKPFSMMDLLTYGKASLPKFDRNTFHELGTPEVMYLWSGY